MEHMGAPAPTGGDDTNDDTPHYGPTAHDLWDTHLATLKLSDPLHPRLLWGLFDGALQAGLDPAGMTLDDLADNLIGKTPRGEWHGPPRTRTDGPRRIRTHQSPAPHHPHQGALNR